MTDTANGHAPEGQTPQASSDVASFSINAQYVKDLSFENPNAPESLVSSRGQPEVSVQVNVGARTLTQNLYEVELSITAKAAVNTDTAFIAEVVYCGVFTLSNVPQEHLRPFLLIECPRFLFPFARAIIADTTREGGFPPLMIQPIDFVELFRRNAEQAGSEGVANA